MLRRVDLLCRHEVMDAGVPVHADVRKEPGQYSGFQLLLFVREVAIAVEDGKRRSPEQVAFERINVECLHQRGDAGRPLLHLGRDGLARRRGQDRTWPDLLAHESGHELIAVKAVELALKLGEERLLLSGEPSWNPGRLEQAEAENPVGTGA